MRGASFSPNLRNFSPGSGAGSCRGTDILIEGIIEAIAAPRTSIQKVSRDHQD